MAQRAVDLVGGIPPEDAAAVFREAAHRCAERVVSGFGIGTECGFGGRDPETVLGLPDLHRAIAAGTG